MPGGLLEYPQSMCVKLGVTRLASVCKKDLFTFQHPFNLIQFPIAMQLQGHRQQLQGRAGKGRGFATGNAGDQTCNAVL
jgi:hypothetical protein